MTTLVAIYIVGSTLYDRHPLTANRAELAGAHDVLFIKAIRGVVRRIPVGA